MIQSRFQTFIKKSEKGVALIAALLLLVLMSALAVALLYKVNYEQRLQVTDSSNNVAFYGAEAGMEKMMSDLTALYRLQAAPSCSDVNNLTLTPPSQNDVGVTYPQPTGYQITLADGTNLQNCLFPPSSPRVISQGPNAGIQAQIAPLRMVVTAIRPTGETVSMIRQIEVARIPIFQFGVFSDSDLSYFPGPTFDFKGRVHTNGNLFMAEGGGQVLRFHNVIRAAKDVVRDQLANGQDTKTQGRTGLVLIPNTTNGCDTDSSTGNPPTAQTSTCLDLAYGEGSAIGGPTTGGGGGTINSAWPQISKGPTPNYYNSNILANVNKLQMAFVQTGVNPIEIIRRPAANEDKNSGLYQSRLYSEAQIRVLLSDDPLELSAGGAGDAQNVRLANAGAYINGLNVTGVGATYFAQGTTGNVGKDFRNTNIPPDGNWVVPTGGGTPWNLLDGYLRVEYLDKDTLQYVPVTQEWLQLGFARSTTPPNRTAPNPVNPNAILLLQQLADRNADGGLGTGTPASSGTTAVTHGTSTSACTSSDPAGVPTGYNGGCSLTSTGGSCTGVNAGKHKTWTYTCTTNNAATPAELAYDTGTASTLIGAATAYNWYPINMYDTREGEFRDVQTNVCKVNGVLNVTEIDVYNLKKWLANTASGKQVEYKSQNGYILYFSDRRGMQVNPNAKPAPAKNGEYGFEDVLNASSNNGDPDGILDQGEDVNQNKQTFAGPETWGTVNIGLGFGLNTLDPKYPTPKRTTMAVNCATGAGAARTNWVSGARHAVRLVDGSQDSLPLRPDTGSGGFTLASENPAYILGNYNAVDGCGQQELCFNNGTHASSAVIADTVTLLSNNWTDTNTFKNPTIPGNRPAADTWYRVAIATGKNINFPVAPYLGQPGVTGGNPDFGTDGGVHNFLRFLESWGGKNIYYKGSMASMYYSMYATGVFKCCNSVYGAPTRNYSFDLDFNDLSNMPPGTPTVTDVVNLGFQQLF